MDSIRFGVIGTNFITDWFLRDALAVEGISLGAVYSRTMERARAYAKGYPAARYYDSLEDMLCDASINAVYIASPNAFHTEQALLAIRHGKHVLLEKPAAPDEAEFLKIVSDADAHHVVALEAMRPAFSAGFQHAKELINSIAPVRLARLSFCQYSSRYDAFLKGNIPNAFDPTLKNGALMDIGVYCVYAAASLFGEPESVSASTVKLRNGVDGAGAMLLNYGTFLAELSYSKISDRVVPSEIQGENGTLLIDDLGNPKELTLCKRGTERKCIACSPQGFGLTAEAAAFLRMVRGGESPVPYQRQTLMALRVMDAARRQTGIDFTAKSE